MRFVITSDHGEEFGERGSWGHAHTLYAEQLHIPLIMSGPGLSAQVIDTPVGTQDIAPTLLRWAGVTSGLSADGVDLGPIAAGAPLDRAFPAETTRFSTARLGLREGDLRLEWDLRSGEAELFARLRTEARYRALFARAFPADADPFTVGNIVRALASMFTSFWLAEYFYQTWRYAGGARGWAAALVFWPVFAVIAGLTLLVAVIGRWGLKPKGAPAP